MRLISFTFATETQAEICATNATAASGATLVINGGLSNYPSLNGNNPYIAQAALANGTQRTISVFSTGNISTSTFTFTGLDVNGYALTTSIAGPTGTAIPARTTSEFAVVYTASVGNTAASSPFTVGFGASGSTNAVVLDNFANPMNLTYAVVKAATSGPVTFQHTFDNTFTSTTPTWSQVTFGSGVSLASQTAATSITMTENCFAARAILVATAAATGPVQVTIIQSGS